MLVPPLLLPLKITKPPRRIPFFVREKGNVFRFRGIGRGDVLLACGSTIPSVPLQRRVCRS